MSALLMEEIPSHHFQGALDGSVSPDGQMEGDFERAPTGSATEARALRLARLF